jgi:predicted SprT family Zn-dependent metalloprotease
MSQKAQLPELYSLFKKLNDEYFQSALVDVQVEWTAKMTARAAKFESRKKKKKGGSDDEEELVIKLSQSLMRSMPQQEARDILLHEMIHAFLYIKGTNEEGHGEEFVKMASLIDNIAHTNIPLKHDNRGETEPKGSPSKKRTKKKPETNNTTSLKIDHFFDVYSPTSSPPPPKQRKTKKRKTVNSTATSSSDSDFVSKLDEDIEDSDLDKDDDSSWKHRIRSSQNSGKKLDLIGQDLGGSKSNLEGMKEILVDDDDNDALNDKFVCPVCSKTGIPSHLINIHLDECLNKGEPSTKSVAADIDKVVDDSDDDIFSSKYDMKVTDKKLSSGDGGDGTKKKSEPDVVMSPIIVDSDDSVKEADASSAQQQKVVERSNNYDDDDEEDEEEEKLVRKRKKGNKKDVADEETKKEKGKGKETDMKTETKHLHNAENNTNYRRENNDLKMKTEDKVQSNKKNEDAVVLEISPKSPQVSQNQNDNTIAKQSQETTGIGGTTGARRGKLSLRKNAAPPNQESTSPQRSSPNLHKMEVKAQEKEGSPGSSPKKYENIPLMMEMEHIIKIPPGEKKSMHIEFCSETPVQVNLLPKKEQVLDLNAVPDAEDADQSVASKPLPHSSTKSQKIENSPKSTDKFTKPSPSSPEVVALSPPSRSNLMTVKSTDHISQVLTGKNSPKFVYNIQKKKTQDLDDTTVEKGGEKSPPRAVSPSEQQASSNDKQVCPVCGHNFPLNVSNFEINQHVDTCLNNMDPALFQDDGQIV